MFTIKGITEGDRVDIIEPTGQRYYEKKETISVIWNYRRDIKYNFDDVDVYIYRDQWGFDPVIFKKEKVPVSKGMLDIILPSDTSSSTEYYVIIQCGSRKAKSPNFGYGVTKKFNVNTHKLGSDSKGNYFIIDYSSIEAMNNYFISIKEDWPNVAVYDPEFGITQQTDKLSIYPGQHLTQKFYFEKGSPFRIFLTFHYSCLLGDYLCRNERSVYYDIPYSRIDGYNIDTNGETKQMEIELFNHNCGNTKSAFDGIGKFVRKLCDASNYTEYEVSSVCTNCFVKNEIQVSNLVLELDMFSVRQASVKILSLIHI